MAGVSSQGTSFTFTGFSAHATEITVSSGDPGARTQRQRVSAGCLADDPTLPEPYGEIWQPDPGGDGSIGAGTSKKVQISYIGQSMPYAGTSGTLSISGRLTFSFQATVVASSVTATIGDVVRGEVTFAVR